MPFFARPRADNNSEVTKVSWGNKKRRHGMMIGTFSLQFNFTADVFFFFLPGFPILTSGEGGLYLKVSRGNRIAGRAENYRHRLSEWAAGRSKLSGSQF